MSTRLTELVIDAGEPEKLACWWGAALGWEVAEQGPDEWGLTHPDAPARPEIPTILFVPVPEPKQVKGRLHLDLGSSSLDDQQAVVARLLAAGASHADVGQAVSGPHAVPWVVLADPEGNEFCVLEPRHRYDGGGALASIVVDANDVSMQAQFWAAATGWEITLDDGQIATLRSPSGLPPDLDLIHVDEPKQTKNRYHLDVAPFPGGDRDAEVERLLALGATRADVGQGPDVGWVVLADPEGNELCVLRPH